MKRSYDRRAHNLSSTKVGAAVQFCSADLISNEVATFGTEADQTTTEKRAANQPVMQQAFLFPAVCFELLFC
jgi:hypothetical protein